MLQQLPPRWVNSDLSAGFNGRHEPMVLPGRNLFNSKMKSVALFIMLLGSCLTTFAEEDPWDAFRSDVHDAEVKFRKSISKMLMAADRVVIYLVDFEGESKEQVDPDDEKSIEIKPYKSRTKIIQKKELAAEDRKNLLKALCEQIAWPNHTGGAFCHYPIHGIRIYQGKELLHEGTFCWMCANFSFSYPDGGSAWLDTSTELKQIFMSLLPIPKDELERFYKEFPNTKPEDEKDGAGKPAATPEPKSK